MGTEITKAQPQNGMQPMWKRLYEADWEQGFNTFMLILAQQYKIELMIQIGNQKQPSPVIEFWREQLRGLSPRQMREGLKGWQGTEQRGFQPTPEDIRENGLAIDASDAPRKKTDPDCLNCGGTGFRYADGRKWSERDGRPSKMTRCDCAVVTYRDVVYKSAKFQLAAAPEDRKPDNKEAKAVPGIPAAKVFPARKDLDLDRNAEKLRQQAETLLKSQTKGDIPSLKKN